MGRRVTKRLRRLSMGLQTVLGLKRQGFFIPYRYAGRVAPLARYPAFETLFAAHEAAFARVLDAIDARAGALAALDGPPPAPRWDQDWFPRLDGAAAYAMVAARRPARIVEVGSGHSTRFMARAVRDEGLSTAITCIDPAPRAAISELAVEWRGEALSAAHRPLFAALAPGDVAFFDSSHLLVPGADVDLILNDILPALTAGVIVHFHDILLPDRYPEAWAWRGYAEQNGLGGWLLSGGLRPLFSSRYAVTRMDAERRAGIRDLPLRARAVETSLWAEKA